MVFCQNHQWKFPKFLFSFFASMLVLYFFCLKGPTCWLPNPDIWKVPSSSRASSILITWFLSSWPASCCVHDRPVYRAENRSWSSPLQLGVYFHLRWNNKKACIQYIYGMHGCSSIWNAEIALEHHRINLIIMTFLSKTVAFHCQEPPVSQLRIQAAGWSE